MTSRGIGHHRVLAAAALGLALAATCAGAGGCARTDPGAGDLRHVVVGATMLPASAPVYVADEKGLFAAQGLDVEVRPYAAGTLAFADVATGTLDFATLAETPLARAALDGKGFALIATIAQVDSSNVIIARADRGIRRAEDLKGKRLAYVAGTAADYFQHVYLTTQRVDPASVVDVRLKPDQLVSAIVSGTVDAICSWTPFTTEAQDRLGADSVLLDAPGIYLESWNVITPAVGGPTEDEKAAFLRAVVSAQDYIAANPEEAKEIVARRLGVSADALTREWPGIHWTMTLSQGLILALEDQARWMIESSGTAQATPDFLRLLDSGPLRQVRPQDVDVIVPGG